MKIFRYTTLRNRKIFLSFSVFMLCLSMTSCGTAPENSTAENPATEVLTTETPTTEAPATEPPTTEAPTEPPTTEPPTTECAHDWSEANCLEAKQCSKCGITEGSPLGHDWIPANCTEPMHCSRCDAIEGEPLGHSWKEATYDAPKTCILCGETEGSAIPRPSLTINFLTPVPKEFSYYRSNNVLRDTICVTEVTYEAEPYFGRDDEFSVTFYFTGEKTYDMDGPGQGRSGKVSLKVYDSEGYVVDDDTFYTPSLCVGDKFRNEKCSLMGSLKAGTYNVELLDTN